MHRRRFLQNGATFFSTAAILSKFAFGDEAGAVNLRRLGATEPFDYARLKGQARTLAGAAYRPPKEQLPRHVAELDWDKWQSITFRKDHSLWADEGVPFVARFFHLGFTMTKPVRLYSVQDGKSQQLAYDSALFDYGRSGLKSGDAPPDLGFAGFNLFFYTD